ncbi:MAG: TonB-dependent receptor [Candidatus Korobacteraceae bacterium]
MRSTSLALTPTLFLAFLFSLAAGKASCAGQESIRDLAEATLEQLGSVKVYSASRHLQAAGDAPSSVTVVTADEIQKYGYRTLADILKTVPGFFVTNDRNYSSVGVRGFARPGDYNTRILLLVDGHRLNDNVYDEAVVGTEFPINIDLIQRVEVIRGPVSSLYGSNALFALINIITKRGRDINGLELSADAASFNTSSGTIAYGRKLKELEFLISGTFYGSRGHNSLFFSEFNTPQTNYGIASHADDDQVGSTLATISYRDFTLQGVYGTREKGIPTAPYGTIFNNSGTRSTDSHFYLDLRYQHTFGNSWDVLARTFYDRVTYQGTYIYPSPLDPSQIDSNLDFADSKWWGAELQVTKTVLRRNRVTAGGEYRDNLRQNQSDYDLSPYVLYLADKRQSFVGALYVQDELTISKSLALNVGFRYDYYSTLDASTDPRVALIYRPGRRSAFKFIYGMAFRVPNVYELYYSSPPNLPNPALDPERIHSTEFVWEQGLGTHLWFSTSAFYSSIQGLITQEPVGDNFIFRNLKNVRSSGLEVEVKGQLSQGLEARASYSFQQTKDASTGQFLSDSPRNLVTFNLSQPLLGRRMFVSLDAQYRSRIQNLIGGSISPFAVVNATLLARNLGKHVDLSASIYNLLDKQYFDPPSTENLQQAIQQDGRNFRVKMTWRWGER